MLATQVTAELFRALLRRVIVIDCGRNNGRCARQLRRQLGAVVRIKRLGQVDQAGHGVSFEVKDIAN